MMALSAFTIGNDDMPCNRKNGPSYNKVYNNYDDSFRLYVFQIFYNSYIRRLPTNQLKIVQNLKKVSVDRYWKGHNKWYGL